MGERPASAVALAAAALLLAAGSVPGSGAAPKTPTAAPVVSATPAASPSRAPLKDFQRPVTDCAKHKCVALTFDDGPGDHTARLLDLLAEADAKVTFFLIGEQVVRYPDLVLREIEEGHEVGNHTWHHTQLDAAPTTRIRREVEGTSKAIERILGFKPTLMRPPYGATDSRVGKIAKSNGLAEIIWSVDTDDWRDRKSSIVARRAIRGLHPGSIILMHDIHPTTVDAVPAILKAAKKKGLTLATVSDVLGGKPKPGKKYMGR
ncbi:peptidoglycan/xylan/chitin deacetylase (PgdA/CDA1 family) [Actinocorallia herbida]|uniref:Peptidoglycan/xylan/chitin deacetylase (PgdA/CDA1 family) n=1 Tax=Actinocorallia herbida TaxID=58109 RepID=A0A3N1DAX9_9ACTN|nr:polysaccharide deacetylase family protein [Actinocorallia herbida]ROO90687.1 peptidoglycan/xylan/chitin deacetylase (PgdA/CDA1 family) [Actinocorallia herbida]